jgi:hypothetical protein
MSFSFFSGRESLKEIPLNLIIASFQAEILGFSPYNYKRNDVALIQKAQFLRNSEAKVIE